MLNKPRGLVTTKHDERGRPTVYQCFEGIALPALHPVGRLDQASEGLLLFTNDTQWSNTITDPASHLSKVYHVQINRLCHEAELNRLCNGIEDEGERLTAQSVTVIRSGGKTAWLEFVLHEGKNRQIRRMLRAVDRQVLRLIRIRIGSLQLDDLPKGHWRYLTTDEVQRFHLAK